MLEDKCFWTVLEGLGAWVDGFKVASSLMDGAGTGCNKLGMQGAEREALGGHINGCEVR